LNDEFSQLIDGSTRFMPQLRHTFVEFWSEYKRIDEEIDNYKLYDRVSFQLDIKKQGVAVLIDDLPG